MNGAVSDPHQQTQDEPQPQIRDQRKYGQGEHNENDAAQQQGLESGAAQQLFGNQGHGEGSYI
ncbi:hypothetical protein D3C81_1629710 [compost metagenome]